MAGATFKLVEECSGTGDLVHCGELPVRVRYRFDRYQGMMVGSGMPIPGLHRIVGSIEMPGEQAEMPRELVGADVMLTLEDGRDMRLTVVDDRGSILAEGHGPGRGCSCC